MISFIPFKAEHLERLQWQKVQAWEKPHFDREMVKQLENEWSNTILRDGEPILCGGVILYWENRGLLWSVLADSIRPREFLEIHNLVQSFVGSLPFRRLEMNVDVNFPQGHRWAKLLGFELECERMRAFQVNGADSALYARVKV